MAKFGSRVVTDAKPAKVGNHAGLAYTLWMPDEPMAIPRGVVILHGAGSRKESHHDFARALRPIGCAAIAFDQRGHGDSGGFLDARAVEDVVTMADVLREAIVAAAGAREQVRIGLRGTSMGGFLSIVAAPHVSAAAIVSICPASAEGLAHGLRTGRFDFAADHAALLGLLEETDLPASVAALRAPLLLMHAEGDEQVPVEHSRMLAEHLAVEGSRLITVPGGHHRSIQHDSELQAVSAHFLDRYLR